MTNKEVIEVLEKEESYMLSHGGDRQAKALRIAIDKIEQEPRWIPVKERLPEEGESVLVCYKTQGGIAQAVSEWFEMSDRGMVWSALYGNKPVAWMPLPQPYKAESEDE